MKKTVSVIVAILAVLTVSAAILLCVVFPNKYTDAVNKSAAEFDLPRPLIRAVVWAESRFNPSAESRKGAMGLMQLMPSTLDECAAALGIENADGFDPETSLRCGCYYLSVLLKKFDGDENAALVAYNAGETSAKKYLRGEEIFPETENYIKSVAAAKKLYGLFDR
ncbi:MAG: lytic transglycosylase domain-containing protein [Clostridiales bacterium]|nr:lytic transglycosylase domain-containing protein [Clostridiales bacterium]